MILRIAFSIFTFSFVCLALFWFMQPLGKHARKSRNVQFGDLAGHSSAGRCSV
jgi:hypothetical protein